jgi:hypothetical protein
MWSTPPLNPFLAKPQEDAFTLKFWFKSLLKVVADEGLLPLS